MVTVPLARGETGKQHNKKQHSDVAFRPSQMRGHMEPQCDATWFRNVSCGISSLLHKHTRQKTAVLYCRSVGFWYIGSMAGSTLEHTSKRRIDRFGGDRRFQPTTILTHQVVLHFLELSRVLSVAGNLSVTPGHVQTCLNAVVRFYHICLGHDSGMAAVTTPSSRSLS